MALWHISVPVWGERYMKVFEEATWPALQIALKELGQPYVLFIHTDDFNRMERLLFGHPHFFRNVPGPDRSFMSLSGAHSEVINQAPVNTRICLLTADLVLSHNALHSCENKFAQGKLAVAVMGMRCCEEERPKLGLSGRELVAWGWDHRHPMTRESTWPNGNSYDVWRMYFTNAEGSEVCCRLCLPHPLAVVKAPGKNLTFHPTVDVNLLSHYHEHEQHLVCDPDEAVMLELSPQDKEFLPTESMLTRYMTRGPSMPPFWGLSNPRHISYFQQKIIIKGTGSGVDDAAVVDRLLLGR